MKQIEITVKPDGTVKLDATGFQGGACKKTTEPLRKMLFGTKPIKEELKPEFYIEAPHLKETE